ncbi:adenylyl-sulfate kinase [Rothia koreensis]|uniref:adenylyl-sulfate kinase n=1 Tax=Rothia koreensis TaxID=592378 RepID=UPI0037CAADA9
MSTPDTHDHGTVVWITGLSGAGKTTVTRHLRHLLMDSGNRPVVLDGDAVRAAVSESGGYDPESRKSRGMTYARLAKELSSQGHTVLVATISLFHDIHHWNRENIDKYIEVLLDVPLPELRRRDRKGLYSAVDTHEVVGIGQDAQMPLSSDLVIDNYSTTPPDVAAQKVFQLLQPLNERDHI